MQNSHKVSRVLQKVTNCPFATARLLSRKDIYTSFQKVQSHHPFNNSLFQRNAVSCRGIVPELLRFCASCSYFFLSEDLNDTQPCNTLQLSSRSALYLPQNKHQHRRQAPWRSRDSENSKTTKTDGKRSVVYHERQVKGNGTDE
jgi:hypothetical protein